MQKLILGIIIIAVGVGVGWFIFDQLPGLSNTGNTPQAQITPAADETDGAAMEQNDSLVPQESTDGSPVPGVTGKGGVAARTVVAYTSSGFGPNEVSVAKGGIVTFINESDSPMWVASGVHPTHQLLPGFDQLKSVGRGGSYEYTFQSVGTWVYHNHMNPTQVGTVTVTE